MSMKCNIAPLHAPEKSSSVARSVIFHSLLLFTLKKNNHNFFFFFLVHQVMNENVSGAKYLSATMWGDTGTLLFLLQGHFISSTQQFFNSKKK